jgi:hypothetical protein
MNKEHSRSFYQLENVNIFEVELTSYCNAFCGACFRNKNGAELQPYVNLKHMDEETWNSIISLKNLKNITTFIFDGNLGDASMHPNLIPMLDKLAAIKSDLYIKISSNGGARNSQWWSDLAKCLQKFKYHQMSFSVDGLEDTNHIYRRNVNWNTLIKNIKSFNDAGGISRWRAIIFDHNKHQINEMMETAETLGCVNFITFRNREPVIEVDEYKHKLKKYTITGPDLEEFNTRYKFIKFFKNIDFGNAAPRISSEGYSCPFAEEGKVSIDENGYVWPCCFTSVQLEKSSSFPVREFKSFNNIKNNYLEYILEKFRENLYSAWDNNSYKVCNKCLHKRSPPTTYKITS